MNSIDLTERVRQEEEECVCRYASRKITSIYNISVIDVSINDKISRASFTLVIGCIYRPSSSNLGSDSLLYDALSKLTDQYPNFVVLGDFNLPQLVSFEFQN